jgi:hypothetical protein
MTASNRVIKPLWSHRDILSFDECQSHLCLFHHRHWHYHLHHKLREVSYMVGFADSTCNSCDRWFESLSIVDLSVSLWVKCQTDSVNALDNSSWELASKPDCSVIASRWFQLDDWFSAKRFTWTDWFSLFLSRLWYAVQARSKWEPTGPSHVAAKPNNVDKVRSQLKACRSMRPRSSQETASMKLNTQTNQVRQQVKQR